MKLPTQTTHKLVKKPRIYLRDLADFMAASEVSKRTIARGCKYRPIARLPQHLEAKQAISAFLRSDKSEADVAKLTAKADELRSRIADSPFDRDLFDHNADYISRFIIIRRKIYFPKAEITEPHPLPEIVLNGVAVKIETHAWMQRVARNNIVRVGSLMLRYKKGKVLPEDVGEWQSAFLFGYLRQFGNLDAELPDHKLCVTLDAFTGVSVEAPGNSIQRFKNMAAACATIAERWPNIEPPANAVL